MIKILWPKATWGFICLTLPPPHTPLSKDIRAGTEAEASEWSFLVDPCDLPGLLSYLPRATSPGVVPLTMGWAILCHTNLENATPAYPQASSQGRGGGGANFSVECLSSHHDSTMLETIYWKMNWSLKNTKWPIIKQGPGELLDLIMPEGNRETYLKHSKVLKKIDFLT